ncbi:hypothetical protein KFE25_011575 [Diacronema lutheri]|uniref:Uncharacterized protein n=1 Tax=Diacronema lutheri TaxID=2081491 RepID=A0A8J6CA04_DIALT|nr:hypothetical protein KFE25_011575 [Diacronema lutheri]
MAPMHGAALGDVYKVVAALGGRLISIFDGQTEYALGVPVHAPAGEWLYACASYEDAVRAPLPRRSRLRLAPRAVLRCTAWGEQLVAAHGHAAKLATEWLCPEELLPMPLGYTTLVRREGAPSPAELAALAYDSRGGAGWRRAEAAAAARTRTRSSGSYRRPASAQPGAVRDALALLRSTAGFDFEEALAGERPNAALATRT